RRRTRGHVSILFAVALLFISALVFFVGSVGERYLQKETVQGAADAAAFSARVAEANAFNPVAFTHLVLSIAVALASKPRALAGGRGGRAHRLRRPGGSADRVDVRGLLYRRSGELRLRGGAGGGAGGPLHRGGHAAHPAAAAAGEGGGAGCQGGIDLRHRRGRG